jgi:hypothetical protein
MKRPAALYSGKAGANKGSHGTPPAQRRAPRYQVTRRSPHRSGAIEHGVKPRYRSAIAGCGRRSSGYDMIRFLFRMVGFLILAGGFVTLIYDGTRWIAGGTLTFTPLGQVWNNVHSNSLQLLQPAIERHVSPFLWDPVVLSILTTPAWIVFAIIGAILMLIGRKKKPLIGYVRD